MKRDFVLVVLVTGLALAAPAAAQRGGPRPPAPIVPLCPGLRIVTAVSQADGDYESIKTIESVSSEGIRLKYSVERLVQDMFGVEPPKLGTYKIDRAVSRADLDTASLYLQQFSTELPELIPGTTAIGTSAAVLHALKTKGKAQLGIFIAFSQEKPSLDRNVHPNVYDNKMVAEVTRVGDGPVMIPVIVNDVPTELPAIHASGDFFGDRSEFFFLDDPANPMTLKFRIGIDAIKPVDAEMARLLGRTVNAGGDKDVLTVVKISYDCAGADRQGGGGSGGGAGGGGAGGGGDLERALAEDGRADVYSIYFSFNSDVIREESEPTLREIAEVLRRNPGWRLTVSGHTDGIGDDAYNLDLSRRRAAAVKAALVMRYGIAADRLSTVGFGEAQPKDTNETIEGRARNRRVELVRN